MRKLVLIWIDKNCIITDMENDTCINLNQLSISKELMKKIYSWADNFEKKYLAWLNDDKNNGLFNLDSDLHVCGMRLCALLEAELKNIKCYYWFDVDRSVDNYRNYEWKNCPICSSVLKNEINDKYKHICHKCGLVMP